MIPLAIVMTKAMMVVRIMMSTSEVVLMMMMLTQMMVMMIRRRGRWAMKGDHDDVVSLVGLTIAPMRPRPRRAQPGAASRHQHQRQTPHARLQRPATSSSVLDCALVDW